jgi:predicted alpha/beta-fold hydrolase
MQVSRFIVEKMKSMHQNGFDLKKFYFVGYSLGAHLSGYIGRGLRTEANITLSRITALEPG